MARFATTYSEDQARAMGYTKAVAIETDAAHYIEALVQEDADMDGDFAAWDSAEGDVITVHGWTVVINEGWEG